MAHVLHHCQGKGGARGIAAHAFPPSLSATAVAALPLGPSACETRRQSTRRRLCFENFARVSTRSSVEFGYNPDVARRWLSGQKQWSVEPSPSGYGGSNPSRRKKDHFTKCPETSSSLYICHNLVYSAEMKKRR